MYWEDMREEEFPIAIANCGGLCILPLSSMEKKGQYLPVAADGFIADSIIKEALKLEDAVVFPTGKWLGDVCMFNDVMPGEKPKRKGAIELSQDLQITVLQELCDEIGRNGFRKILIVYKQPGNAYLLGHFMRCMAARRSPYATICVDAVNPEKSSPENVLKTVLGRRSDFPMITDEDIKTLERWAEKGYGGSNETYAPSGYTGSSATFCDTALVMAEHADLVAEDRFDAEDYQSTHMGDHLSQMGVMFANMWNMNYPNGYAGFPPHGCTKSIGEAILKINAEHLANILHVLKKDEECVNIDARSPIIR